MTGEAPEMREVTPTRTAARYVGGKRLLAREIVKRIDATPHALYGEAFVGMGGVFLRRRLIPPRETINDRARDIANFFRVLQRHEAALLDLLKWTLTSRAEYDRLKALDPDGLTDLERAARFLYLQRMGFGGKGRTFGVSPAGKTRGFLGPGDLFARGLRPALEAIHARLSGVVIEGLDWRDFLARWDRPYALFYLDPPYMGSERFYGPGLFPPSDHEALADVLSSLKGRFILTMCDTPEARRVYGRFAVETAGLSYSVGGGGTSKPARELIVTGGGGAI